MVWEVIEGVSKSFLNLSTWEVSIVVLLYENRGFFLLLKCTFSHFSLGSYTILIMLVWALGKLEW